jgi:hypothetical protein
MVYTFVVTLKNHHRKLIDRISYFVMAISAILFLQAIITAPRFELTLLIITIICIIAFTVDIVRQLKSHQPVSYRNVLFIIAICWLAMPYMKWIAIPVAILALIENAAKAPLEIGFTDAFIMMNHVPKKKYKWSDFNNIVLKDGYLTLDFRNNKLIQQEVLEDEDDDGDEDEFNEFCQKMLTIHSQQ